MTDYEQIVISAVRYALGRMTYIVDLTVNYVIEEMEQSHIHERCLKIIKEDIKNAKYLGWECDQKDWKRLLDKIEERGL